MNLLRIPRMLLVGTALHLKYLSRSEFQIILAIFLPLVYSTVALLLIGTEGNGDTPFNAVLGAGLMGVWSTTLFGCGAAIQLHRQDGTLQLMVAAPLPLPLILLQYMIATVTTGVYAMVVTVGWSWLVFGVQPVVAEPLWLIAAIVSLVVSLAALGLLLSSTFVLVRNPNSLTNILDFPIWLACGLLVPTTFLPGWVGPISEVLSPTWGARAMREAASGGSATASHIGICLGLGTVYLLLSIVTCRMVDRLARVRGTLLLV